MPSRHRATAHASLVVAVMLSATGVALGQGRTDVVTLSNGDRITGEIIWLERGRLEFKTDDVEVVTGAGQRFLGSLGSASLEYSKSSAS